MAINYNLEIIIITIHFKKAFTIEDIDYHNRAIVEDKIMVIIVVKVGNCQCLAIIIKEDNSLISFIKDYTLIIIIFLESKYNFN